MWIWIICSVVALVGAVIAYRLIEPAPPERVVIAAGPAGGAYRQAAESYARIFANNGVELVLLETAGSVENYERLLAGEAEFGIVQGGTLPEDEALRQQSETELQSVASIYLEPLFVFYRTDRFDAPDDLASLAGKTLAVGTPGSGTRRLAVELLNHVGINPDEATYREIGGETAAEALETGEIDAAFMVAAPDAPVVEQLMRTDGVALMPMRRAEAISRQLPYLQAVTLPEGAADLEANLPPRDIPLVAPAAVLVTRAETHSAAVLLAAVAAQRTHRAGTLLSPPDTFPNDRYAELPQNATAAYHFRNGPTFLRRSLPFWIASFVERGIIVLVPLLTLLIPLVRITPPIYRWRVRSRIYRWYAELREIDDVVARSDAPPELLAEQARRLESLEREALDVVVPLSYMQEFYNLRLHIGYLRRQLRAAGQDVTSPMPATQAIQPSL